MNDMTSKTIFAVAVPLSGGTSINLTRNEFEIFNKWMIGLDTITGLMFLYESDSENVLSIIRDLSIKTNLLTHQLYDMKVFKYKHQSRVGYTVTMCG